VAGSALDCEGRGITLHAATERLTAMSLQVVITDCPWEDNSIERVILQEIGAETVRAQCATPEEVIAAAKDADALLVGWAPINRKAISELRRCRFMMRFGVGYENIDLKAATEAGIAVANNPDYCVEEVATHAVSFLLACHRQLAPLMHSVRSGEWDPLAVMWPTAQLREQTAGLLGLGRIGRRVAEMVASLVKTVLVYDPIVQSSGTDLAGVHFVSLQELLQESDYLSIHAPLTPETQHLFSDESLSRMKPASYLINCSRGAIVDEQALVRALEMKKIAGAALDVFSIEPLPMDHPLRRFPNVIITPHAAWYSERADYLLRANPARAVVRFFRGEPVALLNSPAPGKT
jgi:D-3-phosphoglycerate dehydrogenase / 2-oxoglutarate reductase